MYPIFPYLGQITYYYLLEAMYPIFPYLGQITYKI